ncbi:uncharacterized protein LOC103516335 [Diaphorina citri]|uniref:Uncharacterized protein LOC103516335 n=2 Tax=Diaphorina citri TaxID=121845 RepID=A0A1S3DD80_DIACI|nr:uncharacterized protein LOC103516335 [Diaphorina citri]KAI5749061.1 hypothetical protein M8J76_004392 [Diaphorina citri]
MASSNDKKVKSMAETTKKKVQKSLKNVVASPYNQQYWYPLQKDDLKTLQDCMGKNLPALVNLKSRIPWKQLKKLSKDDRKTKLNEKRNKIKEVENNQPLFHMRSFLTIGLNETSKHLSQDGLCCIVVDGSPKSKRIAVFLVNMAFAKHIPVVICPGLLELTLSRFGFKTVAFGIKKKVNDSAEEMKKLISLQNIVVEMFSKQVLTQPILCDRFKQVLEEVGNQLKPGHEDLSAEHSMEDESCDIKEEKPEVSSEDNQPDSMDIGADGNERVTSQNTIEGLYRYRTNNSYRVFIPQVTTLSSVSSTEDFISVASSNLIKPSSKQEMVSMNKRTKTVDDMFFIDTGGLVKPPVVKKIKPNPKRVKGKLKGS